MAPRNAVPFLSLPWNASCDTLLLGRARAGCVCMCVCFFHQVHYIQAGWYFRRGQHTLAARYYARTPCCFEEIGTVLLVLLVVLVLVLVLVVVLVCIGGGFCGGVGGCVGCWCWCWWG